MANKEPQLVALHGACLGTQLLIEAIVLLLDSTSSPPYTSFGHCGLKYIEG